MKSKKKEKCHINNRKYLYLSLTLLILTLVLIEPAYCATITDEQIRAATTSFSAVINNWVPIIIGAGLIGGAVSVFTSNYRLGIAGIAGSCFLCAAKAFVGANQSATLSIADQILQVM